MMRATCNLLFLVAKVNTTVMYSKWNHVWQQPTYENKAKAKDIIEVVTAVLFTL